MYNCDLTERSSGGTALLVDERSTEIREEKVMAIRRQLDEGRYAIAERLDEVVDMLLDLFGG